MRLLVSWLRDFVPVDRPAAEIGERLGLRGFELAGIEELPGGDAVIDVEVTANRPDCLSVVGLAREVSAAYDVPLQDPHAGALEAGAARVAHAAVEPAAGHLACARARAAAPLDREFAVTIEDLELCPRYAAALAEVTVGPPPAWIAARLQASGIRSISSVVDITNYVLIERGHPTHAFDLEHLAGPEIRVRRAAPGERLTTLDGVERALDPQMLVIADRDRPQAVAGVMGGAAAEVSDRTRFVVFESAYFKPASVRLTSKRLGLKTEASARFERGADVSAPVAALARIAALLEQTGAGRVVGPFLDVYPITRDPRRMHLRRARLAALLGAAVPDVEVERILTRLGLTVTPTADGWDVDAPTFRVDLAREVDLIEEVGRHYGFERLPSTFPVAAAPPPPPDAAIARDQLVRRVLTAGGLSEAVTFGVIERKAADAFGGIGARPAVAVANPLSGKFDTLRPSLVPGLVDAVAHNRRHGQDDVGLFEIGTCFSPEGESRAVAIAWTGFAAPVHWSAPPRPVDFFDVKGMVEQVCRVLSVPVRFEAAEQPPLVPGQTASVLAANGQPLGVVGQLRPGVADARGLPRQDRVFVAELDLDRLAAHQAVRSEATRPLPRHPFVVRDLSFIVPDALPAAAIRGTIQAVGATTPAPLTSVTFFDRYHGQGIPEGSVSLSVRMTFQAEDRTLTDAEVQASVDAIVGALGREYGAVQR